MAWIVVLIVGMLSAGWGQGWGFSAVVSDKARLFTNAMMLVQHAYTFWHDYNRYSNLRVDGPNMPKSIFNSNMPGWATEFTTDIVVFISDIMNIYPIIYDYLTWKIASRADPVRHLDLALVLVVAVFILFKIKTLAGINSDTRVNGVMYNQAAYAFSMFVLLMLVLIFMTREHQLSPKSVVFVLFFFGVCTFLYMLVEM